MFPNVRIRTCFKRAVMMIYKQGFEGFLGEDWFPGYFYFCRLFLVNVSWWSSPVLWRNIPSGPLTLGRAMLISCWSGCSVPARLENQCLWSRNVQLPCLDSRLKQHPPLQNKSKALRCYLPKQNKQQNKSPNPTKLKKNLALLPSAFKWLGKRRGGINVYRKWCPLVEAWLGKPHLECMIKQFVLTDLSDHLGVSTSTSGRKWSYKLGKKSHQLSHLKCRGCLLARNVCDFTAGVMIF